MKVLMLPAWFPSDGNGYTGTFIRQHAVAVAETGANVDILYLFRSVKPAQSITNENGILVYRRGSLFPPKIGLLTKVWEYMYLEAFQWYMSEQGKPDIIHAHSYIAGAAARAIALKYGVPYIITEHSSQFVRGLPFRHQRIAKGALDNASAVIVVSEYLARHMRESYSHKVIVIPNPVDANTFTLVETKNIQRGPGLVSVGSLLPEKGHHHLVEVMPTIVQKFPNASLTIVGEGPELQPLIRMSEMLGVRSKIEFAGRQLPSEVNEVLQSANLYISASRSETFGVAIAEALVCGLPVIVTPSGGPEEFVNARNGIILNNASVKSITTAVSAIVGNYDRYDPVDIRREAEQRFGQGVVGKKITGVYDRVLNSQ